MEYDVCAVLDRSYKVRSRKCVIHYEWDLVCMSDGCELLDIDNIGVRVSECLNMDRFCVLLDRILNFLVVERINEGCCHTVLRKCMCEEVVGSSVDVLCCNDVVTCMCKVFKYIGCCRCTGCNCKCCNAALKCCDSLFKYILGRVCQSSIDVSGIGKSETCCCMFAVFKYIGRSLVDRDCSRICHRIRLLLSDMKL